MAFWPFNLIFRAGRVFGCLTRALSLFSCKQVLTKLTVSHRFSTTYVVTWIVPPPHPRVSRKGTRPPLRTNGGGGSVVADYPTYPALQYYFADFEIYSQ